MLAFSVNVQRIALHLKIRVFADPDEVVYRFVANFNDPPALAALYLDLRLFAGYELVQCRRLAALTLDGMQQVHLDE